MANCTDPECLVTKAGIGPHEEHPAPNKISGDHIAGVIDMPLTAEKRQRINFNIARERRYGTGDRTAALEQGISEGKVIPMDIGRANLYIKKIKEEDNG